MSTFESFKSGLEAGQKQAKVKREDDARQKAAEAFSAGNYEGASQSLMGVGLMDEAGAYGQAGERKKTNDRTKAYADAYKTGLSAGPAPADTQQPKGTTLPQDQEAAYQQWINKIGMTKANGMAMTDDGTGLDYDMRGFFQKYGPVDVNVAGGQHFTDEFKLPNHKTFSNESKYAVGADAARAGSWNGDTYMPAPPPPPSAPNYRGGYDAVRQAAASQGDFATMQAMDETLSKMDATQAKQFSDGMEFLGSTAQSLKGIPAEARGQAAMEILQNSPYANPQVLAQIQQAAADGRITDEELDNFAQQTMSVADRVKAKMDAAKGYTLGPGQKHFGPDNKEVASVDPRAPGNGINLAFDENGGISGLSIGGTGTKGNEPAIVRGPNGQPVVSPGAQQLKSNKDWQRILSGEEKTALVRDEIKRALPLVTGGNTGGMAWTKDIPFVGNSLDSGRLANFLKTIRTNVGFDELNQMRQESPTGGALGQVAVQEIDFLQSVLGSMEQSQRPEDILYNLNRLDKYMESRGERRREAFAQDYPDLAQFAGFGKQATSEIKRLNSDPNKAAAEYEALPSGAFYINPDTGKKQQKK